MGSQCSRSCISDEGRGRQCLYVLSADLPTVVGHLPTPPLYTLLKISAILSILGSSNGSFEESLYAPRALTVLLCPEYSAVAELALSVMKESKECVIWCPSMGNLSMAMFVWYFPLMDLWAIKRAAVIMLVVMPSPMKRIRFLALRLLFTAGTTQFATVFSLPSSRHHRR
jgi:hypothetical protein